jgi:NADH:ubiquinone oxidoreductase subunit D/NADH:ubiquinone oxidoreductase subunit C
LIEDFREYKKNWLVGKVESSELLEVVKKVKEEYRTLITISPTDFLERIELNYFFTDLESKKSLWLKTDISRENSKIESISHIFGGANWHEREAFSTFGVDFIGHPNLKHIIISSDFYGKAPFRKDFDIEAHQKEVEKHSLDIASNFEDEFSENSDTETTLNWGPTHPASGPLRLKVGVDGEEIKKVSADIGFVWRALENLIERKDFVGAITAVERICFMDNTNSMLCYAMAVEEIAGVKPTPFAEVFRVILGEVGRVSSHFMGIGGFFGTMGLHTLQMWAMDSREYFLDFLEDYSGARIATASIEAGGVRFPLNLETLNTLEKAIEYYESKRDEFHSIFLKNPMMKKRASQIGIISADEVHEFSMAGVVARASGVETDIRKDEPYSAYEKFDFKVVTKNGGSAKNRFEVIFEEIDESVKILKQAVSDIRSGVSEGTYNLEKDHLVKVPKKLPKGEAVSRVEWARGELMMHLVTEEKGKTPYRLKIKAPSFNHTMMVEKLLEGCTISDIPIVFGSMYICQGDLDR